MKSKLLHDLSVKFGLGAHDLLRIIVSAPARYKVFQIPKRRGGMRTIAQPSRELKAIQRFVLQTTLSRRPVHSAATGYIEGKNIRENARLHLESRVILKLDFKDFFPSIRVTDWQRYARSSDMDLDRDEIFLYSHVLFWGQKSSTPKCLSIGAPTSPALSNILLFDLDSLLSAAATKAGVVYSRYADDITASGGTVEAVRKFEVAARSIVRRTKSPKLMFNEEKRGLYTMGERRMVTGLILTPTQRVSIGRERKRIISAMLHKLVLDQSGAEDMARLKGLLGFCIANEPEFISRMRIKYGSEAIDQILRYTIPRRLPAG